MNTSTSLEPATADDVPVVTITGERSGTSPPIRPAGLGPPPAPAAAERPPSDAPGRSWTRAEHEEEHVDVSEVVRSDSVEFSAFYRDHWRGVARGLALTLGDADLAAEATDEAMARAYPRWGTIRTYDNPAGWVYRVGLNWARSYHRRIARLIPFAQHDAVDLAPIADPAIREALLRLDIKQRSVVVCRLLLDWSVDETAAALEISPGTVKSRLHRALAILESTLADHTQVIETMSFEDDFRTTLQSQADDLDLRGRGPREVMHLARRRQHRARRAGAVAAVGVLGIGTVGVLSVRSRTDDVTLDSASSGSIGLPDVGPLELQWQTAPSGVTGGVYTATGFTEDAGVLYALSTAPGERFQDDGTPPTPTLYRMADDGTWAAVGDATAAPLVDVEVDGSVLYAIGTAPGAGAVGYDAVLSSSADGGTTWAPTSTAPVAPPSAAIAWKAGSTLAIERLPGATVAVVSTTFLPAQSVLDAAVLRAGETPGDRFHWELADTGLEVVSYTDPALPEPPAAGGTTTVPPTTVPPTAVGPSGTVVPTSESEPAAAVPTSIGPDGSTVYADDLDATKRADHVVSRGVVATISWAEAGVSGPRDLTSIQVLVERDGAWVPVASPALEGVSLSRLTEAGQDLLLEGWSGDGGSLRTFSSADGLDWRPVPVGEGSRLSGMGNAWIDVPWNDQAPEVRSSFDRGATWASVDLGAVDGRLSSTFVTSVDSGPLGLALVAADQRGGADAVSYLVTTRDLQTWTVTPLSDITGAATAAASVHVGTDRVVITATEGYTGNDSVLPSSVTAIGTPLR